MKKIVSTALAALIAATSSITFAGAAEAHRRDRHHDRYERHYHNDYYRHRRHHRGNGDAVAAGVLGFALGAIVAGAAQNRTYVRRDYAPRRAYDPYWEHVRRCEARYRSYDRYSDTFIGYDGRRYYCTL